MTTTDLRRVSAGTYVTHAARADATRTLCSRIFGQVEIGLLPITCKQCLKAVERGKHLTQVTGRKEPA